MFTLEANITRASGARSSAARAASRDTCCRASTSMPYGTTSTRARPEQGACAGAISQPARRGRQHQTGRVDEIALLRQRQARERPGRGLQLRTAFAAAGEAAAAVRVVTAAGERKLIVQRPDDGLAQVLEAPDFVRRQKAGHPMQVQHVAVTDDRQIRDGIGRQVAREGRVGFRGSRALARAAWRSALWPDRCGGGGRRPRRPAPRRTGATSPCRGRAAGRRVRGGADHPPIEWRRPRHRHGYRRSQGGGFSRAGPFSYAPATLSKAFGQEHIMNIRTVIYGAGAAGQAARGCAMRDANRSVVALRRQRPEEGRHPNRRSARRRTRSLGRRLVRRSRRREPRMARHHDVAARSGNPGRSAVGVPRGRGSSGAVLPTSRRRIGALRARAHGRLRRAGTRHRRRAAEAPRQLPRPSARARVSAKEGRPVLAGELSISACGPARG